MTNSLATLPQTDLATIRAKDSAGAAAMLNASMADNTKKSYRHCWGMFLTWCNSRQLDATAATPQHVIEFFAWMADPAQDYAFATIKSCQAAINKRFALARLPSPAKTIEVAEALHGIARTIGTAQRGMDGLTPKQIASMIAAVEVDDQPGADIRAVRDKCIILLGYITVMRVSNLVTITKGDVKFVANDAIIHLKKSKTDQTGKGVDIPIKSQRDPNVCAVAALHAWIDLDCVVDYDPAPIEPVNSDDYPLFCATGFLHCRDEAGAVIPRAECTGCYACVDGDGYTISVPCAILDRSMHHDTVRKLIKRIAALAGIDGKIGPHSMRRGGITAMAEHGQPIHRIQAISGHKSLVSTQKYIAPVDAMKNNATDGMMDGEKNDKS